jgi:hypothetical protein
MIAVVRYRLDDVANREWLLVHLPKSRCSLTCNYGNPRPAEEGLPCWSSSALDAGLTEFNFIVAAKRLFVEPSVTI